MEPYKKAYLYKRIVTAKIYIENNFSDSIDLSAIADSANFSKYHFFRLFKEIYGLTPLAYLTALRIEKSKGLLAKNVTVLETAILTGFESATSFSAVFKKITKLTPAIYKRLRRQQYFKIKEMPLRFVPACFAHSRGWLKNSNIEESLNK